jgi:hypothetical protein
MLASSMISVDIAFAQRRPKLKTIIKIALRFLPCAFDATEMNRIQVGTNGLWLYRSDTDNLAAIVTSGYFNPHALQMNNGDVIIVSDNNAPTVDMLAVSSASKATPVTVINGT